MGLLRKSDSGATIFIRSGEEDAVGLKGAANNLESGLAGPPPSGLEVPDRHDAHAGHEGKVVLAPVKQASGGPTLCGGDHDAAIADSFISKQPHHIIRTY
jgi:hypothetical protein